MLEFILQRKVDWPLMNSHVAAYAGATQGWAFARLNVAERLFLIVAGTLLLFPSILDAAFDFVAASHIESLKVAGIALTFGLGAWKWSRRRAA